MTQLYAHHARRGAELLDRRRPGWHLLVSRSNLQMETCDRCILGQVFEDFATGFKALIEGEDYRRLFSAAEHGFTLPESEQDSPDVLERFRSLGDAWRAEIAARLGREGVMP